MTPVRTLRVASSGDRHGCTARALRVDRTTATTTIDSDCGGYVVRGLPDASGAAVATSGLRRTHHVLLVLHGGATTCSVGGTTRVPGRRPVGLGAALALSAPGVPGFVVARS